MKIPAKFLDKSSGRAERKEYIWLVNTIRKARRLSLCVGILLFYSACGNQTKKSELIINDSQPSVEQLAPDTTSSVQEEAPKNETPVSSSSSSSHSQKSSSYDNMRGFDPASKDDMDDNGMSRYMENNDEEGWD